MHKSIRYQMDEWVKGNSIHNNDKSRGEGGECCPDFSCCTPETLAPENIRIAFKKAMCDGDEEASMGMLMDFLGKAISNEFGDKKVHIAGDNFVNKACLEEEVQGGGKKDN